MDREGYFGGGVFISYRRTPALAHAEQLFALLADRLGARRVFFDKIAIPPGAVFPDEIKSALERAHLVLVVISPGWAEDFKKREQSPEVDWVRQELAITRARLNEVNPPEIRIRFVGGASMPKTAELPDELHWLTKINAYPCEGSDLSSDVDWLADISAAVPRETTPLDARYLTQLAGDCAKSALGRLERWPNVPPLNALKEKWVRSFSVPGEIKLAEALDQLESCLQDINTHDRRVLESLSPVTRKALKEDCTEIVEALLGLGACRLAARLPALGDHTTPISAKWLATQVFAVAHSQEGRQAQLSREAGAHGTRNRLNLARVLDQGPFNAGILDDESSTILDQLWRWVRVNDREQPNYPPNPKHPGEIEEFAEALNALSRKDGKARVTIGLEDDKTAAASHLRRWLVRMRLDVDVLVRTGASAKDLGLDELNLIGPCWRCINQIESIAND